MKPSNRLVFSFFVWLISFFLLLFIYDVYDIRGETTLYDVSGTGKTWKTKTHWCYQAKNGQAYCYKLSELKELEDRMMGKPKEDTDRVYEETREYYKELLEKYDRIENRPPEEVKYWNDKAVELRKRLYKFDGQLISDPNYKEK
jgi:hypothetical protein